MDDRDGDECLGSDSGIMDKPRTGIFQSRAIEFYGRLGDVLCDVDGAFQASALSEYIVSFVGRRHGGVVMAASIFGQFAISEWIMEGAGLVVGLIHVGFSCYSFVVFSPNEYLALVRFDRICGADGLSTSQC